MKKHPHEKRTNTDSPDRPDTTSAIERMTDDELAEEQRVLNAEIEAATQRLCSVENELFHRQHPECRRS
jgi:hypothetical protein